ncbi:MAG: hypothetical protein IPJ82_14580 [Lewinellaceae bacterium]|nr:hypothetical protein [Lewinellaceae bacterium]
MKKINWWRMAFALIVIGMIVLEGCRIFKPNVTARIFKMPAKNGYMNKGQAGTSGCPLLISALH